ncbi:UDP-3-O-(3-hydroxymyristoyl)glucosamine N-acyltransferase [Castellaniella sp. GW247-6E4]|uniref:UDP-3-O-(3-hydroxymyristoyl)glucosamine N-acyltransferase n=1 Tax=Castellaniella sp. GW247-6E4 TaxID=3140380 RepID=UPI003316414E
MPVLLAPDQAPDLPELLNAASIVGLDWSLGESGGGRDIRIAGIGSLSGAGPLEISFLSNPKLADQLAGSRAAAVILRPQDWEAVRAAGPAPAWTAVLCSQPYLMYALLAQWFDQRRQQGLPKGIHPSAVIAEDAEIAPGASVGPLAVIEAGVRIGAGTRIGAGCVIGPGCVIGRDGILHARVTLYHGVRVGDRAILHAGVVLGADGFGFAPDPGKDTGAWSKIAQLGGVLLGDDIEIGANTTVDRGAIEDTVLGNGVKLDNQIMIGHNCHIGDHTAMAACVGVAGSTTMGKRCVIGGAAMFAGHLTLGDDVHISGGTAVTGDILEPGRYTGVFPAAGHAEWQRNAAVIGQLAQLRKRLRAIERQGQG